MRTQPLNENTVEKKAEELYPIGEDLKNNVWGREEKKGKQ
jgi:hypothetical protein